MTETIGHVEALEERLVLSTVVNFTDQSRLPSNMQLVGAATLSGSGSNRYITLTEALEDQRGSVLISTSPTDGNAIDFTAEMRFSIKQGSEADGMSFGYGPIRDSRFGEHGDWRNGGLWVGIDTYENGPSNPTGIYIFYNKKPLDVIEIPSVGMRGSWNRLYVDVDAAGNAHIIMAERYNFYGSEIDLTRLDVKYRLPGWNPSPSWKFGVGARTGGLTDRHIVEEIKITTDNIAPTASISGTAGIIYDNQQPSVTWSTSDKNLNLKTVSTVVKKGTTTVDSSTKFGGTLKPSRDFGLGVYTVKVTATDYEGAKGTADLQYELRDDDETAPTIVLSGSSGTESHGDPQQFSWSASDPKGVYATHIRLFKDGTLVESFDSAAAGTLNFDDYGPGTYTISVGATDDDNNRTNDRTRTPLADEVTRTVIVTNTAPVANAGPDQRTLEGTTIQFDGSQSADVDRETLSYIWDFGDGTAGTGVNPSHVYADDGIYTVTLTVIDAYGAQSSDTMLVKIANRAPVIHSVTNDGPVSIGIPVTVTINASDVSGDALSYEFDFDNDGIYEIVNTTGTATHSYAAENTYPVPIRVKDDDGAVSLGYTAVQVGAPATSQPVVEWLSASQTLSETSGSALIAAQLSEVTSRNVVVPLSVTGTAMDGEDFALSRFLVVPAGQLQGFVRIELIDDLLDEEVETLTVAMETPINAILGNLLTHTVTLTDDDPVPDVSFTERSQTVAEHDGRAVIVARLSAMSGRDVLIPFGVSGTADPTTDYSLTDSTIMIPAGSMIGMATIQLVDDGQSEPNETVIIQMETPTNARLSGSLGETTVHTVTIPENDAPSISFTSVYRRVNETLATIELTAELSTAFYESIDLPLVVSGSATRDSDFTFTTNGATDTLHFAVGETQASALITVIDDQDREADEQVVVQMGAPDTDARLGAVRTFVLEIAANDTPAVRFSSGPLEGYEDEGVIEFKVELDRIASEDVVVPVFVAGGSAARDQFVLETPLVTIPKGTSSGTGRVRVFDDSVTESTSDILLLLGNSGATVLGNPVRRSLLILDDDPLVTFTRYSQTMLEGQSRQVEFQLSAPTNKPVTIPFRTWSTRNNAEYSISGGSPGSTVTIPAGQTRGSITIHAPDDQIAEQTKYITVWMGDATNAIVDGSYAHTTILEDNDTAKIYFSSDYLRQFDANMAEQKIYAFLSQPSEIDVVVDLNYSGTATPGVDYQVTQNRLRIPAGEQIGSITLNVIDDGNGGNGIELNETVVISMSNPINASLGANTFTLEIMDGPRDAALVMGSLSIGSGQPSTVAGSDGLNAPTDPEFVFSTPDDTPVAYGEFIQGILESVTESPSLLGMLADGYIVGATTFFDANRNGIHDFLDLNGDGVQDPGELTEPAAQTSAFGWFELDVPDVFDLNRNGRFDTDEGQLASYGGVDTGSRLSQSVTLTAPLGSSTITPLTSIMARLINEYGFDLETAQQRVIDAFELPQVPLTRMDPVASTVSGDASGPRVFAMGVQIQNTIVQLAEYVSGLVNAPPLQQVVDAAFRQVAWQIRNPSSQFDVSNPFVIGGLLQGVLNEFGLVVDEPLQNSVADVIASGNRYIDEIRGEASIDYLTKVVQAQTIAQGETAIALKEVAEGNSEVTDVVASSTGSNLASRIAAASVGNVFHPIIKPEYASSIEGDSGSDEYLTFSVTMIGTPAQRVTVDFSTDATSSATPGLDYLPVAGTLTWEAGDSSPQTVRVPVLGDKVYEGDESVALVFANSTGDAVLARNTVFGTILDDDPFSYEVPDDGVESAVSIQVNRNDVLVFRDGVLASQGSISPGGTISITGAEHTATTFVVDLLKADASAIREIRFVGGDATDDQLKIINDTAGSVDAEFYHGAAGEVTSDGLRVVFSGIEQVEDSIIPQLTGLPVAPVEGESITLTAERSDADAAEFASYEWAVRKNGQSFSNGQGSDLTFTPDDNGEYVVSLQSPETSTVKIQVTQHLAVLNADPSANISAIVGRRVEGQQIAVTGFATDPAGDNDTLTYHWLVSKSGTDVVFAKQSAVDGTEFLFVPDDSGVYHIQLTVDDEDGGSSVVAYDLVIENVAPEVTLNGTNPAVRGETVHLPIAFEDPSRLDTHTITVDWGDGTSELLTEANRFEVLSHVYSEAGNFSVLVTVTDSDGDSGVASTEASVDVIALRGGDLFVGGTSSADSILFSPRGRGHDIAVSLDGHSLGVFRPTGRLVAFGQAGDDTIRVAGNSVLSAWLYGNQGDDLLSGGHGDDVLFGGPGDDVLHGGGGQGRDLLIGGRGADRIIGQAGDDLLIAGWTSYDPSTDGVTPLNHEDSIHAIMSEWTSARENRRRIANLIDGTGTDERRNGSNYLTTFSSHRTLFDDEQQDLLTGASGDDWFLFDSSRDIATDLMDEIFESELGSLLFDED